MQPSIRPRNSEHLTCMRVCRQFSKLCSLFSNPWLFADSIPQYSHQSHCSCAMAVVGSAMLQKQLVAKASPESGVGLRFCASSRCSMRMAGQVPRPRLKAVSCGKIVMTTAMPTKEVDGVDSKAQNSIREGLAPADRTKQVLHSMAPEKLELIRSLDSWAEENLLPQLKPVEKSWQPQDYLPDPSSENFLDEVRELRERAANLPDDYLVCLVGDTITEEALPTYQTMLNTLDGVRDETGSSSSPWGLWTRSWTAEENRHGDLLNKYLYLTGRVDMRQIEKTIQYLIGSGMDPQTENNPYLGFVYTAFQERATFISHGNTARHAKEHGDQKLAVICGLIAADERRHEVAYTKIVDKLFDVDPSGAMLAFSDMMRKKISMPAHLMYDGQSHTLFDDFSLVAQRTGVYTSRDYADIMEHLVKKWRVEERVGLSSEAQKAQDFVCKLPPRIRKLAERDQSMKAKKGSRTAQFSWIFNREVQLI